jgi:hypothetical protein
MLPEAVPNSTHHAHAVNNRGQVAGEFFGPGGSGVFLWSAATGTINLGGFPPFKATVLLNDRGDIIANFSMVGGDQPFVYRNGTWTNLNDLVPPGTTLRLHTVHGINNKGWIVGSGRTTPNGESRGFILIPPTADLRANGQDLPVTLGPGDGLQIDLSFDTAAAGPLPGAEIYFGVSTDAAILWYGSGGVSLEPVPLFAGTVPSFGPSPVLSVPDVSDLPAGHYRFFAIVDRVANGVLDADVVDVVDVHIVEGSR